jgi:hypothetical protein
VTRALLWKELREHGPVFAALYALEALAFAGIVNRPDQGSAFAALQFFTARFGLLTALVVGNRLIVREYAGRTQLFLELLPVTRLRVLFVKLGLGACLVALPVLLGLGACALLAADQEPLTARYVAIVGARALAAVLLMYSLAFLAGLLGRYRLGLWLGLALGAWTLDTKAKLELESLPLVRLLNQQMAYERFAVPWSDLAGAALAAAVLVAIAFALGLARDGSLAATLARRMSYREKVFFGCLTLVWVAMVAVLEDRKARPLFALADSVKGAAGTTLVGVAPGKDLDEAQAQKLGELVATDLEALRQFLDLETMPPVFLLPEHSLDADVFLRARLPSTDGVVVQAALSDQRLDTRLFRAFVVGEVLDWYSRGRDRREPRRWFSDGFARWFVDRDRTEADPLDRLRAAVAAPEGVSLQTLHAWLATREQLGDCLSGALAWRAVEVLAHELGPARFQALARAAQGRRPANDLRGALSERTLTQLLADADAPSLDATVQALNQALADDRARRASELGALTRWQPKLGAVASPSGPAIEVHHSLSRGDGGPSSGYTLLYARLEPWARELDREELLRFDTTGRGILPVTFQRGSRLFTAFEVFEPGLACNLRLRAERWEAE